MSRHELFDAYIAREINRRAFVQGLMALGVSAGVAASYAVALQPAAAGDGGSGDQCSTNLPQELYDLYCNPPTPPADTDGSTTDGKRKKRRRKKHKKKH